MHAMNSKSNSAQQFAHSDIFNSADATAIATQMWYFQLSAL